ncbi:hypothetical protein [Desulfoferula mesophila]|uniref:Lipoprotein n=1 Tax=Desulfoferula mesophila TaxID=3058419 RepID=A0AAU9EEM0_9BACT|nr:hypothetical protein FAK_20430 [Desulfoferula mesophilus]
MKQILIASLLMGLALGVLACAGPDSPQAMQENDKLLISAGFDAIPANTPERMQHLKSMPQHRILHVVRDGNDYYLWADAQYDQCLWVGNWEDYQRFKKLGWDMYNQGGQARDNYLDGWSNEPGDWAMWGPW